MIDGYYSVRAMVAEPPLDKDNAGNKNKCMVGQSGILGLYKCHIVATASS